MARQPPGVAASSYDVSRVFWIAFYAKTERLQLLLSIYQDTRAPKTRFKECIRQVFDWQQSVRGLCVHVTFIGDPDGRPVGSAWLVLLPFPIFPFWSARGKANMGRNGVWELIIIILIILIEPSRIAINLSWHSTSLSVCRWSGKHGNRTAYIKLKYSADAKAQLGMLIPGQLHQLPMYSCLAITIRE